MSKEEIVYKVKLAEHSERYQDMIVYIKALIEETKGDLNNEERTLLCLAFKQVVGQLRTVLRIINRYEEKAERSEHLSLITEYKKKLEKELQFYCLEFVNLIDSKLLKGKDADEVDVFYLKMKADYYGYMAEAGLCQEILKTCEAYFNAFEAAKSLPVNNWVRLGLALNFSVFCYEIQKNRSMACEVAKNTLDEALPALKDLDEQAYKDASFILQIIQENLTLWIAKRLDNHL